MAAASASGSGGSFERASADGCVLPNEPSGFRLIDHDRFEWAIYAWWLQFRHRPCICFAGGYEFRIQNESVTVAQGATDTVNIALTAITTTKATLSGIGDRRRRAASIVAPVPVAGATVSIIYVADIDTSRGDSDLAT